MRRLMICLLVVTCLAATPQNIVKERDPSSGSITICQTEPETRVCPYCGLSYQTNPEPCPGSVAWLAIQSDPHPLIVYAINGEKWETCQVSYIRAMVKLTGAKRIEEPKP